MKRLILVAFAASLAFVVSAEAQVRVRGYTRSDGTYVAPSVRSRPNGTTADNYSTQGNVNPYTGRTGTAAVAPLYTAPAYVAPTYRAPATGATCQDGTASASQSRSGTCSGHGGVRSWH